MQAALGDFKCAPITKLPTWDDISYWVIETEVKEDLEYKIKKLEQEHIEMTKLVEILMADIKTINSIIDSL